MKISFVLVALLALVSSVVLARTVHIMDADLTRMDGEITISSWPDGMMMAPVESQLPLPNEVSVGIEPITSPILAVSAVAVSVVVSAVITLGVAFPRKPPWKKISAGVTHELNRDCSINGVNNPNLEAYGPACFV